MVLYVNEKNEIKAVNTTGDTTLRAIEIDDSNNPFAGWNEERICCFKVGLSEGNIIFYVPYVDINIVERVDSLAKADKDIAIDVTDIELAMTELYEMILGGM